MNFRASDSDSESTLKPTVSVTQAASMTKNKVEKALRYSFALKLPG